MASARVNFIASPPQVPSPLLLGTIDDVALAALYLVSPASSWVTGKVFEVDGGTVASNWPLDFSEI